MVIAIDGPSGVGKTTVSRGVADALGLEYLDTGSTYRAATLAVLRAGVDPADTPAVIDVVRRCRIGYHDRSVYLDGDWVGEEVRAAEVTAAVSAVSAIPEVRESIVAMQRLWVSDRWGHAVVEGRDIGTVVFPDAMLKVYLTARPEVRARRRAGDAEVEGKDVSVIEDELRRRDHHDSTRDASPLQVAADAHVIDTSELTAHEVVERILELVDEAKGQQRLGPL